MMTKNATPRNVVPTLHRLALCMPLLCGAFAFLSCGNRSPQRTGGADSATYTVPEIGTITTRTIPLDQGIRGDGDADNPRDIDGNGDSDSARVGGADNDSDVPVPESYRFPDGDDRATFAFGRPAGSATAAITSAVRRYFAAAGAADGTSACPLLLPSLARSVPASRVGANGQISRGGGTCATALSALFAQFHEELAAPVTVVSIRRKTSVAEAIVSSRTLRAGRVFLVRRGRSWGLEELLSSPLP